MADQQSQTARVHVSSCDHDFSARCTRTSLSRKTYKANGSGRIDQINTSATENNSKSRIFSSKESFKRTQYSGCLSPEQVTFRKNMQEPSPILTPSTMVSGPKLAPKTHPHLSKLVQQHPGFTAPNGPEHPPLEIRSDSPSRLFQSKLQKFKLNVNNGSVGRTSSLDLRSKGCVMVKIRPHLGDIDIPLITNKVGLLESRASNSSIDLSKVTLSAQAMSFLTNSFLQLPEGTLRTKPAPFQAEFLASANYFSRKSVNLEKPKASITISTGIKPCLYLKKRSAGFVRKALVQNS